MSKSFDFNAITQQTLEVTLNDPEHTMLHVTTPPERLIEQLAASLDDLTGPNTGNDFDKIRASYKLAAELMSCNLEGIQITAEDLREKYKVMPIVLAAFVTAYMDFINDFHNAKN